MSSAGIDNQPVPTDPPPHPDTPNTDSNPDPDDERGISWWILAVGAIALGFVVIVGTRVMSVLAALLFPPMPAVPPNALLVEHEHIAYGVDQWEYRIQQSTNQLDVCQTAQFYLDEGGICTYEVGYCDQDNTRPRDALAATCSGIVEFSSFFMPWEAQIYDYPDHTRVILSRDITWLAPAPLSTPQE